MDTWIDKKNHATWREVFGKAEEERAHLIGNIGRLQRGLVNEHNAYALSCARLLFCTSVLVVHEADEKTRREVDHFIHTGLGQFGKEASTLFGAMAFLESCDCIMHRKTESDYEGTPLRWGIIDVVHFVDRSGKEAREFLISCARERGEQGDDKFVSMAQEFTDTQLHEAEFLLRCISDENADIAFSSLGNLFSPSGGEEEYYELVESFDVNTPIIERSLDRGVMESYLSRTKAERYLVSSAQARDSILSMLMGLTVRSGDYLDDINPSAQFNLLEEYSYFVAGVCSAWGMDYDTLTPTDKGRILRAMSIFSPVTGRLNSEERYIDFRRGDDTSPRSPLAQGLVLAFEPHNGSGREKLELFLEVAEAVERMDYNAKPANPYDSDGVFAPSVLASVRFLRLFSAIAHACSLPEVSLDKVPVSLLVATAGVGVFDMHLLPDEGHDLKDGYSPVENTHDAGAFGTEFLLPYMWSETRFLDLDDGELIFRWARDFLYSPGFIDREIERLERPETVGNACWSLPESFTALTSTMTEAEVVDFLKRNKECGSTKQILLDYFNKNALFA